MLTKKLCYKFKNKEKTSLLGGSHGRLVNQAKKFPFSDSTKMSHPHLVIEKHESRSITRKGSKRS